MQNSILSSIISNGNFKKGAKVNETNLTEKGTTLELLEGSIMFGDPTSYVTKEKDEMRGVSDGNLNDAKWKPINVSEFPILALKSIVDKAIEDFKSENAVKIIYELDEAAAAAAASASAGLFSFLFLF